MQIYLEHDDVIDDFYIIIVFNNVTNCDSTLLNNLCTLINVDNTYWWNTTKNGTNAIASYINDELLFIYNKIKREFIHG